MISSLPLGNVRKKRNKNIFFCRLKGKQTKIYINSPFLIASTEMYHFLHDKVVSDEICFLSEPCRIEHFFANAFRQVVFLFGILQIDSY